MLSPDEALGRLREGNARFAAGKPAAEARLAPARRAALAEGQRPFAIILGCSDSRVPVELVFDQAPGDLFVIRVAGNTAPPSALGSVEFAAEQLGARLAVVLGHTGCGAVAAACSSLFPPPARPDAPAARPSAPATNPAAPGGALSENMEAVIAPVRAALAGLAGAEEMSPDALQDAAVDANIRASARQLRAGSAAIDTMAAAGQLRIICARYCLQTGAVAFFEEAE